MKPTLPLISVILPVYNAARYLPSAISSVLNQTYSKFELIIIDDHSTDNSYEILKSFAKSDRRIRLIRNTRNRRIAYSLNRGIKLAKGQYIARMDADDISYPSRLAIQVRYLINHPDVVILGGQCRTIDQFGDRMGTKIFPTTNRAIREMLYTNNPLQHPTVMINRTLLPKNFSWYNVNLPPAEDLDLFFRLGNYGRYANLKSFVLKYRQYPMSQTFKNPKRTYRLTQKVRAEAISKYGYQPTLKARVISTIQTMVISLLPNPVIYPLYSFIRGTRNLTNLIQPDKLILWPKISPRSSTASL